MSDVRRIAIAEDVGRPLVLRGVCVAGANIASLQSLEILESAQFIGHCDLFLASEIRWCYGWCV